MDSSRASHRSVAFTQTLAPPAASSIVSEWGVPGAPAVCGPAGSDLVPLAWKFWVDILLQQLVLVPLWLNQFIQ